MSTFVDRLIEQAGLWPVFTARAAGDFARAEALLAQADLLLVGAIADRIRARTVGDLVRIHPLAEPPVTWVRRTDSEVALLRSVALTRATSPDGARIGVDWGEIGLEVAQVALGFGASDLTGPITKKSGALISADDLKKVKGQGMVAATALKRREIAAVLQHAGRTCEFTDEHAATPERETHVHA